MLSGHGGDGKTFLSSNTQDFIEVRGKRHPPGRLVRRFLSSNTQDFIEVSCVGGRTQLLAIPEFEYSGLH